MNDVGVIFDLDGTILDSMPIWDNAGELFLNSMGIQAEPGLGKTMFCMSMVEGAEFLKARYGLNMEVNSIMDGINHIIEDFYFYQVQLKVDADQFLKGLKEAGIKMVVATSSDMQVTERALERLSVLQYFDCIFTCTEIGEGKSQPDIYQAAAKYLGTLPEHTWVFEDALYAIQTAKNAGFHTVGVYDKSSEVHTEEIQSISDLYFTKLENVNTFLEKAGL